ncbi:hypothetical protein H4582DRAFT_1966094 [Lactarius indigo]|nr:hypothetical protein H4582DRAFT_1966094 [Lactarius indigo]
MDQHRRSPLPEATVRCLPKSSSNPVFAGDPGLYAQLRGLLVPDVTEISTGSDSWNISPFLSTMQQLGNGLYPPIVGQEDRVYDPLLEHSLDHHATLSQSVWPEMTDDCRAFTDIIANSNYHERFMTLEEELSITPFGAVPQEAIHTHSEGDHLVVSGSETLSQLRTQRGVKVENTTKKPYKCNSCSLSFTQRQGLKRHSQDKHEPKQGCSFCAQFTWSQGRRYVYRKHLQEEHPGVVSPSLDAAPVARRRGINPEGRNSRQNSVVHRSS